MVTEVNANVVTIVVARVLIRVHIKVNTKDGHSGEC